MGVTAVRGGDDGDSWCHSPSFLSSRHEHVVIVAFAMHVLSSLSLLAFQII